MVQTRHLSADMGTHAMSSVPPIHPVSSPENAKSIAPPVAFWCGLKVPESLDISEEIPHVNNAKYVRWIDRTAELATDAVGLTREMLLSAQRMWFVARHEIGYRGECSWATIYSLQPGYRVSREPPRCDVQSSTDLPMRRGFLMLLPDGHT